MKVLQINSVCGVGSTGRITTDLYKVLQEKGYECVIAYGRGKVPDGYHTIKIGSTLDNYMHVVKSRALDKHGFGSKRATEEFVKKVREFNPDIIHLHNIHGYYINVEILFNYLKEANKPVVWTLHDCWAFTGHCAYFDYIGCNNWKTGCYNCSQKKEYPTSRLLDNSIWNYQRKKELFTSIKDMTIVTPSVWLGGLVESSFLGKYNIKVINNGIDLSLFKPTNSNFREKHDLQDKFIILGVASFWEQRKGLKYLIELANDLDSSYQVIVVGVTDKQIKNLPTKIIGITRTNNAKELVEIYSSADVFVNPTLEDNFPTVNLEALACGTPVITFDTGGGIECLDKGCGFIVEKKNVMQIINIIRELQDNRNLNYAHNCRQRAFNFYNKSSRYADYIELYNQIFD